MLLSFANTHYSFGWNTKTQSLPVMREALLQKVAPQPKDTIPNIESQTLQNGQIQVVFEEIQSQREISMNLTAENMQKLQEKFGAKNFERQEDSTKLKGEAQKLVSGWWGEIAYKMNFLSADKDQNGKLSEQEKLQTNTGTYAALSAEVLEGKVRNIDFRIIQTYAKTADLDLPQDMQEMLNQTLQKDKNLDGKIDIFENFGGKEKLIAKLNSTLQTEANRLEGKVSLADFIAEPIKPNKQTKESLKEMLKAQELLNQLLAAQGDLSILSAEDKKLLESVMPNYKSRLPKNTESFEIFA